MLSDDKLVNVYSLYCKKLKYVKLESQNSQINFKDFVIPEIDNKKDFKIFILKNMASDFTRELINNINVFRLYIKSLVSWQVVLDETRKDDKPYIIIEFLAPLVDFCINQPYSIRNKYIFSITHLIHQARTLTDIEWADSKLPNDDKINYKTLVKVVENYMNIDDFLSKINNINNQDFLAITSEYRSRSHNRYPRNIEFGYSPSFKRQKDKENKVVYYLGGEPAILISELIQPLLNQHLMMLSSIQSYWEIIMEIFKLLKIDKKA